LTIPDPDVNAYLRPVPKIIPIPNTKDELRLVSILPILSKAFEKIMEGQISSYLSTHEYADVCR